MVLSGNRNVALRMYDNEIGGRASFRQRRLKLELLEVCMRDTKQIQ